jgi:hypothetical protein
VTTIAAPTITRSSLQEPDCYGHFNQIAPHSDLCRASLGLGTMGRRSRAPEGSEVPRALRISVQSETVSGVDEKL